MRKFICKNCKNRKVNQNDVISECEILNKRVKRTHQGCQHFKNKRDIE